jgi:hypothetical protein
MNQNGRCGESSIRVPRPAIEDAVLAGRAVATADGGRRWLGGRAAVSTTPWPAGLAAGDPAVARFGFVVTFACLGSYSFPCQYPASAGMADTFAVS